MRNKIIYGITALSIIGNITLAKRDEAKAIPMPEPKPIREIKPLVDPSLIAAMITIESNGNVYAYNKNTGAIGLMQLTPVIYKGLCGMSKADAFNPAKNKACGELYMSHLLNKYKNNVEKALLHYNNGHVVTNKKYGKKVMTAMRGK